VPNGRFIAVAAASAIAVRREGLNAGRPVGLDRTNYRDGTVTTGAAVV
jgi:hypothetical protein